MGPRQILEPLGKAKLCRDLVSIPSTQETQSLLGSIFPVCGRAAGSPGLGLSPHRLPAPSRVLTVLACGPSSLAQDRADCCDCRGSGTPVPIFSRTSKGHRFGLIFVFGVFWFEAGRVSLQPQLAIEIHLPLLWELRHTLPCPAFF